MASKNSRWKCRLILDTVKVEATLIKLHLICFLLCVSQPLAAGTWKRLDSKTIKFEGEIEIGEFERFKSVFNNQVTQLIVNSPGGQGGEAVRIGNELFKHKVDVYVAGECMSACANALFLAGHRKFLTGTPTINGNMTVQMGHVCYHGVAGHGDTERVNQDQAENGDRLFSGFDDEAYKQSKKFFLDAAKTGQPLSPKGFAIKTAKDHDRYWQYVLDVNKAEREFFKRTGASPRLMTLFFETGSDWNCPTAKGFAALGVKEVFGDSTLVGHRKELAKFSKMYVFDGTLPESDPACAADLTNLKAEGRCKGTADIKCLRDKSQLLSEGCKAILGIVPPAGEAKIPPPASK